MGSQLKRALGQTHSWGLPESHLIIGSLIVPKGGKIMGEMADFFFKPATIISLPVSGLLESPFPLWLRACPCDLPWTMKP